MWEDEVRIPPPGYRSAPQRRAAEARRRIVAAGGVGAILALCVVGYFAANRDGPEVVPVIQAPSGLVKVKPDDPGGLQVNTQTNTLLENDGTAGSASLAATPEAPDPAALAASANQAPAPPTSPSAPSPVTAPSNAPSPATAAETPATPAVAVPAVPETPAPSTPQQTAMNPPAPSAGAAAVHNLALENNPPIRSSEDGHVRVQLAALSSQEAALQEWSRLTHRMPGLFGSRRPIFVQAHVNGHTFWRVRTAGFLSVTDASRFCDNVRAEGAACTVALF